MLKKLITYKDFNGRERKENFYFYLSQSELLEMELGTVGGMQNLIQLIIDKQDIPEIIKAFKTIILKSYGEKSADGVRFIKSEELSTAFSQTDAYNKLFMELISNAEAASDFINGIIPDELMRNNSEPVNSSLKSIVGEEEKQAAASSTDEEGNIHLLGQR